MIRIFVLCEGKTEQVFVNQLLGTHFSSQTFDIRTIPLDGASTYGKIKRAIEIKCKQDPSAYITTLLDYYRFPTCDFPDQYKNIHSKSSCDIGKALEKAFENNINNRKFIAYLSLHEFEGLLFSDPEAFKKSFDQNNIVEQLQTVAKKYASPEHINDSPDTAPSKRIKKICPGYKKTLHGPLIAQDIGLEKMREKCEHFDAWIRKLEQLT